MPDDPRRLSDMAKVIRRAGLPVRRGKPKRKLRDAMHNEKGTGDTKGTGTLSPMFGEPLDSWEPRYRPEAEAKQPVDRRERRRERERKEEEAEPQDKKGPEIHSVEPEPDSGFELETRTVKRMKKSKSRRMSLSVSMSPEEAQMLRMHAASMDLSFSSWARNTLFRAMGRKTPARPKRD